MTRGVLDRKLREDDEARRRIASSLDESLWVEAAAGTGKTTELVGRITAVLASGRTTVDRIVAVTFTRKAAGELKLRLRHRLDLERQRTESVAEREALEVAMSRLEEARIGTIHSFCAELLRERPVEAGVDPAFIELDEAGAKELHRRSFDLWVQSRLGEMPPTLSRVLARLGVQSFSNEPPLTRLRQAAYSVLAWRDYPQPWRREAFPREKLLDQLIVEGRSLAGRAAMGPRFDSLRRGMKVLEEEIVWLDRAKAGGERNLDLLEARWVTLHGQLKREARWKGRGKKFGPLDREEVVRRRDDLISGLEAFRERSEADLAAALREEFSDSVERYEELKRREGKLDFLDLLLRTRDLVRDNGEVREHFQQRLTHLFVDEFQDTDPLQAEILLLLSSREAEESDWRKVVPVPGKLFLVGDPKQSIYRFRRADMVLYRDIKERLEVAGIQSVVLSRSFRAVEGIQRTVNLAFGDQMTGNRKTAQPGYIPLLPFRESVQDRPTVIALPAPYPFGKTQVTNQAIEKCFPSTAASLVDWMLNESGWTVEDPEAPGSGHQVPMRPRHIAFLFRRFVSFGTDVSRTYTRALESRQIPHVLLGARSFHQREEVETLRAALRAVEWPDDELSVYATLRGALFGISDDLLLRYRHEVGRLKPFRTHEGVDPALQAVVLGLAELAQLHRERHQIPIVETVFRLLEGGRAHVAFALRPAGNRVLANVLHVLELARGFEMRGGLSFRRFVQQLDEQAETLAARHSPVVEEGAEGVRLMTVHNAKGLEFPVVFLVDPTARLARNTADTHVDGTRGLWAGKILGCSPWELLDTTDEEVAQEKAEGVRVAYVAATRARDILVVPVVGEQPRSGWIAPLNGALYPDREAWRAPEVPIGCPQFGEASVLAQPIGWDESQTSSVKPGLHSIGDSRVVWWDPACLTLEVPRSYGLRAEDLLVGEKESAELAQGLDRWRQWRADIGETVRDGAIPQLEAVTVTSGVEAPAQSSRVGIERLEREAGRPAGPRFGSLVHGVLRDVEFGADRPRIHRLAVAHSRSLEASQDEIDAAVEIVQRCLAHPLMGRAAAAVECRREIPFVLTIDSVETEVPRVLEGAIDLAFSENGKDWVVVDFKTDREGGGAKDEYAQQLGWYARALQTLGVEGEIESVLFEL